MTVGSPESLFFYFAILIVSIFIWALLLRIFKIKSLALAFALGYMTIVAYSVLKGWRPLEHGGFDKHASEAVTLSWPATLLAAHLKQKLYYVILIASVFQYVAAGWIIEMVAGSIFRDK